MDLYLKGFDVETFDFREITKFVKSYDGTHYGSGVNIMKSQVILNYLRTTF